MDPRRFDRLSKTLATAGTRRALVRLLLGVPLVGSLTGLLDTGETAARRPVDRVLDRAERKQAKRQSRNNGHNHHNGGNHHHNGNHHNGNHHNGNHRGGKGGKGGNPCQGQADRTCCAGGTGKQWCQSGTCVAIPADATATLAECGGRCYGDPRDPPYPFARYSKEVCGQTLPCMSCNYCQNDPQKCDVASEVQDGPNGEGVYCIYSSAPLGPCDVHTDCPHHETQACIVNNCYNICTGAGG
jgi:hypothetical protein